MKRTPLALGLLAALFALPAIAAALDEAARLVRAGDYGAAVERLDKMAPFAPEQLEARFLHATALAGAGQRERAIALLEALIAERPERPEPYNNLAALYAQEGRLEQARDVLERALRTDPSYAAVHDNLSAIYVEMARHSYAKALRVTEESPSPRLHVLHALSAPTPVQPPKTEPAPAAAAAAAVTAAPEAVAAPVAVLPPVAVALPTVAAEPEPVAVDVPAEPAPPEPATPTAAADPLLAELEQALAAWARAWSSQEVETYLGFYSPDFEPGFGASRAQWEAERRARLLNRQAITVTLDGLKLRRREGPRVSVDVMQHYSSPGYSDQTRKRFALVRHEGRWLIQSEKSLEIIR